MKGQVEQGIAHFMFFCQVNRFQCIGGKCGKAPQEARSDKESESWPCGRFLKGLKEKSNEKGPDKIYRQGSQGNGRSRMFGDKTGKELPGCCSDTPAK